MRWTVHQYDKRWHFWGENDICTNNPCEVYIVHYVLLTTVVIVNVLQQQKSLYFFVPLRTVVPIRILRIFKRNLYYTSRKWHITPLITFSQACGFFLIFVFPNRHWELFWDYGLTVTASFWIRFLLIYIH